MTYDVDRSNPDNPKLTINVNLINYDISPWVAVDGSYGLWLGIGYGTSVMVGADLTMCFYNYTK